MLMRQLIIVNKDSPILDHIQLDFVTLLLNYTAKNTYLIPD